MKKLYELVNSVGSDHLRVFGGTKRGGVNLQQIPDEIVPCLHYLRSKRIRNYLEIGAASGGLTYVINEVLAPTIIVIVDNNHHTKSKYRKNILKEVKYEEVIGDSQSEKVVNRVKNFGHMYDLVVVDADHTYLGSKTDIENYKELCRDYLLLHDTVACKGVKRAFEELQEDEDFSLIHEYVSTAHSHSLGIGLFRRSVNVI